MSPTATGTEVKVDPDNEVRFAVVMYGGVSLAIYINGVTQELLDMVKATAPRPDGTGESLVPDAKLTGAMPVYRRLGQYLQDNRDRLEKRPALQSDATEKQRRAWNLWKFAPVRTRFIVDVISGTSAGGINGIFLAKALANNQSLGGLKDLWVSEGDLGRLLNDKMSVADLRQHGMSVMEPRESLLNSQRMYRKLLEALDAMERPGAASPAKISPLVGELDLFVTTTDIAGLPLPIKLADNVVYERRHRNIFHFRYANPSAVGSRVPRIANDHNDFVKENDPFLAYAARCTSSFPFAFEPMRLSDIRAVTKNFGPHRIYRSSADRMKKWEKFFSEYLRRSVWEIRQDLCKAGHIETDETAMRTELIEEFWERSFGDGGYLDNKPFSHATSLLMRRTADVPVERKLVYIEPAPEHPEASPNSSPKPDFLENIIAALGLPRSETIREDLDRLVERNQTLERIGTLAKDVEQDVASLPFSYDGVLPGPQFIKVGLKKLINLYGVGFGAYHRLKLDEVTAMLSDRVARAACYDPASDEGVAIRHIVEAWRIANYAAEPGGAMRSENEFLWNFDIRYCLRRLGFAARRINEISRLNERSLELVTIALEALKAGPPPPPDAAAILKSLKERTAWADRFGEELVKIKREKVSNNLLRNRHREERLHLDPIPIVGEGEPVTLRALVSDLNITWADLKNIMSQSPAARASHLARIVKEKKPIFTRLEKFFCAAFDSAGGVKIADPTDIDFTDAAVVARRVIGHFREKFLLYDLVTYPVLYGSGAGEASVVKVTRISPEDALELDRDRVAPRQKLAGTALMNFGAFLQKKWRRNDMLWGRLDGAERLINAVLPPNDGDEEEARIRRSLVMEAQIAILQQDLNPADRETVSKLISEFVSNMEPGTSGESALRALIAVTLKDTPLASHVETILRSSLEDPERLWEFYNQSFEVDRRVDTENAVRLIARATDIVGRMLQQLAEAKKAETPARIARRVATLGRVFWRAIEVAVPRSLPQLFFKHWLAVIYVFDFVFIIGGILFGQPEVKNFGWSFLALTVGANLIVAALTGYIEGRVTAFRIVRGVLAVMLIALMVGGVLFFVGKFPAFDNNHQLFLAITTAALFGLAVAWAEWKMALRRLRQSTDEDINWRPLARLVGITAILMGALAYWGPPDMARVELAGHAEILKGHLNCYSLRDWRIQLWGDFALLITYSALLATACHNAARLWQMRLREKRFEREKASSQEKPKGVARSRAERWLSLATSFSFLIAGLQLVAGALDAVENAALLSFLDNREGLFWPRVAQCAAFIKFPLVIAGCFCAAFGMFVATRKRFLRSRFLPYFFAALLTLAGLVFAAFFVRALSAPPLKQCEPNIAAPKTGNS